MNLVPLKNRRCLPCEGNVPPLSQRDAEALMGSLRGWLLKENRIERDFAFRDFKEALRFVNRLGEIAEEEGHHPDILLHQYNKVRVSVWTHAVMGLTENDFILAAKIDDLL